MPDRQISISYHKTLTEASSQVNQRIEPQHDRVDRFFGVDDHLLAFLVGDDVGDLVRALVDDGGRDIRLELSSTD